MALSTFRANTFRADTFISVIGPSEIVVVAPKSKAGGHVLPFRRYADTPEVSAEIRALWALNYPTVIVPSALYREALQRQEVELPERVEISYPDRLPDRKRVSVALPQYEVVAKHVLADIEAATLLNSEAYTISPFVGTIAPNAACGTPELCNTGVGMRTVIPPTTVMNPTDEELVLLALRVI
jgi:hypothetical protein